MWRKSAECLAGKVGLHCRKAATGGGGRHERNRQELHRAPGSEEARKGWPEDAAHAPLRQERHAAGRRALTWSSWQQVCFYGSALPRAHCVFRLYIYASLLPISVSADGGSLGQVDGRGNPFLRPGICDPPNPPSYPIALSLWHMGQNGSWRGRSSRLERVRVE